MIKDIRICFAGDSFVNGTGDETALGWAGRLCAWASTPGVPITYYNLGVRRNTSRDILQRWESECLVRLPKECDCRIVFSFGVNDTVLENGFTRVPFEEACRNAKAILTQALRLGYNTLMIGPPPVIDVQHNERIGALSQAFANEAMVAEVPYIDLFTDLIEDEKYKIEVAENDGAHPESEGYKKMAHIISSSTKWWFHVP